MSKLAINGGKPVRKKTYSAWPIYGKEEEKALINVLHSGKWGNQGAHTGIFEKEFAEYHGARFGRTVCNGTVSLIISLQAIGINEGDEVIVPPYTFLATATAVCAVNALPVFVDIDENTCNLNPELIEPAITERTRAIIPVHFGGLPADMEKILSIAKKHNLKVIEDAAHAHGSIYKGKKVGSLGNFGSFSFQSSKNLCAGEGGIILTNNRTDADMCETLRNCGRLKNSKWYEHGILGGNFRLSQFQAAILSAQLKKLDSQTKTRNKNGIFLDSELAKVDGIRPLIRSKDASCVSYHAYIFRYNKKKFNNIPKSKFVSILNTEGIPVTIGYTMPLNQQPLFKKKLFGPYVGYKHARSIDYAALKMPVCEKMCTDEAIIISQNVMLGTVEDISDIVTAVKKVQDNLNKI